MKSKNKKVASGTRTLESPVHMNASRRVIVHQLHAPTSDHPKWGPIFGSDSSVFSSSFRWVPQRGDTSGRGEGETRRHVMRCVRSHVGSCSSPSVVRGWRGPKKAKRWERSQNTTRTGRLTELPLTPCGGPHASDRVMNED